MRSEIAFARELNVRLDQMVPEYQRVVKASCRKPKNVKILTRDKMILKMVAPVKSSITL